MAIAARGAGRKVGTLTWVIVLFFAGTTKAESERARASAGSLADAAARPTGTAEFGLGWLTLPGADVCVTRIPLGCSRGDSSLVLEAWQMFRVAPAVAVGAGLTLGLTPTAAPERSAETAGIHRHHRRRYLTIETMGRYYPYVGDAYEAWVGATAGMVVVSDTYSTIAVPPDDRDLVGPKGVTIRTEGFSLGAAVGGAYQLSPNWLVGANLRFDRWLLPTSPARDPLGDEASLVGGNSVFVVAVNLGCRVPL